MDVPAAPPAELLQSRVQEALSRGATVLTGNQRAARTLRRGFDLRQRELGLSSWGPPAILAWDTWLGSLWGRLLLDGIASDMLLNLTQERALWHEIVAADRSIASLRPTEALAETAASAWSLLHAYQGRRHLDAAADTSDTRAFVRWARSFERLCRERRYLTRAGLPEALRGAVVAGQLQLPPELLLVGFDSRTPAQKVLLDSLGTAGARIDEFRAEILEGSAIVAAKALDGHDELSACARWLRERIAEQPECRVAVIVPSIEAERAEIDRVFREVLAPECNDIGAEAGSGPYEFSLGVALSQTALAAVALDILHWSAAPVALDRVTALLLSACFAPGGPDSDERLTRAEFDAFVLRRRQLLVPEISLSEFADFVIAWKHASRLPVLSRSLRGLQAAVRRGGRGPAERTYAEWAAAMHDLLEAAGWNQSSGDTSIEFQTRRKWESALDELATLDFEGGRVTFAIALGALERIAMQTLFAPGSRHAPVQIMGPLEAAGSAFDAIWFLRANDLTWPAAAAPNPLLPWRLQRELSMPGADPARDFELARWTTARVAASAPSVIFSFAEQTAEGRQRVSPALTGVATGSCRVGEIVPSPIKPGLIVLESIPDNIPIPPPPDRPLQGGATILAAQAACGFRAFAEQRLFSSEIESGSLGLDPRERGKVVHDVLEQFWEQVETQAALRRLTTSDRDAVLSGCIDEALGRYRAAAAWPHTYLKAEGRRLHRLLRPWLDFEAEGRSPFAVKSREADLEDVRIGPLRLNVRVDRVDASLLDGDAGGEIILDYKTGIAKPADWLGERPDAPQLPLYAVVSRDAGDRQPLAAIAFANVRLGEEMGLHGFEAREGILRKPGRLAAESLDAQVAEWRTALTSLAEEFHAGHANVSPKRYPQTCQHCAQRPLCRLDVAGLNPDVLDPETLFDEPETAEADGADLEADFA